MTSELTIIIVSLGGLILTATVSLGVLILTQFRTSRRDLDERLAGIDSRLSDAAREIRENRDRIAQVEVSLANATHCQARIVAYRTHRSGRRQRGRAP